MSACYHIKLELTHKNITPLLRMKVNRNDYNSIEYNILSEVKNFN